MTELRRHKVIRAHGAALSDGESSPMTACGDASEWEPLLYDHAKGLTDQKTAAAVERHLAECADCRRAYAEIRRTLAVLSASAPTPAHSMKAQIMDRIREEEEDCGRVVWETVDMRTGRVVSSLSQKRGIRRAVQALGGIAAVMVIAVGLLCLLPFLRTSGGAASSEVPDIIGGMQVGSESSFNDGVFVGNAKDTDAQGNEGYGAVPGHRGPSVTEQLQVQQYAVVLDVSGADKAELLLLLAPLAAEDSHVTLTEDEGGIAVSPLSAYESAAALLEAAELAVVVSAAAEGGDENGAFYIRIREP